MRRICLWCPIMKWKEIICESVFIQIDKWILLLKMVEREIFLMKLKHQYLLSQWGEFVYGAQSLKEGRLLSESMFIPIKRRTSILKMIEREVFPIKPKHQYHLSLWRNVFTVPNHEKKGNCYVNRCLSQLKDNLWFKKW